MSNRYPKNSNFNNIVVRNNGNGKITSDCVYTDTIYVKNLVVTDSLNLPVTNIETFDKNEVDKIVINKEFKKISKNSGKLLYNPNIQDVMIQKNGVMQEISYNNDIGNISNILQENTRDQSQSIINSSNKFNSIQQTIDFKGLQPPNSSNFLLGSHNNINFLLDDSSFYLFEGYVVANIKKQVFPSFGKKPFLTNDDNIVDLKRNKIEYSSSIIKNGLIKIQENDINNYEIINLQNRITSHKFRLKKLSIGNKCYLAIETENTTKNYISWRARINITKINVISTLKRNGTNLDFYILKNKPVDDIINWNCYSLESNSIFFRLNKKINFYNIPLYNLSKIEGNEKLNTIFYSGDLNNYVLDKDQNENLIVKNNDTLLKEDSKTIYFNKNFNTFYTVLADNISILVKDSQDNLDSSKPFAYKHNYYHQSKFTRSQKTNYVKSKGFWKTGDFNNKKFKQSQFFSILDIDSNTDKLINYVYLPKALNQGSNNYYDYYLFSMNSNFVVNFAEDKIPEFKKLTFLLDKDNNKNYFIYKDIRKLNSEYSQIYLSNRSVYNFKFGTINVIEGKCIIIDSDKLSNTYKMSKSIKIYADFYIPTFQNIRSDLINKLLVEKLSISEINKYLENAYLNKNFRKVIYRDIDDEQSFIPIIDDKNKKIDTINNKKLFNDFNLKISLALRNINLDNLSDLNYATISRELTKFKNFYLKVEAKSSLDKSYQINILFENNIFDIFSI